MKHIVILYILILTCLCGITNLENRVTYQTKSFLDSWIDELINYECRGCGEHFRQRDSNGKWSYSCLQFQEETWLREGKRYGILEREAEVDERIYDCTLQKNLAKEIWAHEGRRAVRYWKTSIVTRGLGIPGDN